MADFSSKPIEELQSGDVILDGHLNPVEVITVISSFLGKKFSHLLSTIEGEYLFYGLAKKVTISKKSTFFYPKETWSN